MKPPLEMNAAFAAGDAAGVVAQALAMEEARTVLDIGCGRGGLARALMGRGFAVTGIDPSPEALADAGKAAPDAEFRAGTAEELPFADNAFDAAVFLNSLHHVPAGRMDDALSEAARVTRPDGPVLVVEPLAEGSFFETMRPIEDESAIRRAAGEAVARTVAARRFALRGNVVFERPERFAGVDAFIAQVVAVDPARAGAAKNSRAQVEALFERNAIKERGNFVLNQPLRIYWLRLLA